VTHVMEEKINLNYSNL